MTCAVVGVGVTLASTGADTVDLAGQATAEIAKPQAAAPAAPPDTTVADQNRIAGISRDAVRRAIPVVTGHRWTTADLDLRLTPQEGAPTSGELKSLRRVGVTGAHTKGFTQIVVRQQTYWVTNDYLAAKKPTSPAALSLADTPCAGTSGVESGITPAAIRVYRAVCNNFPQITRYGGYDAHGEHRSGKALDIMTSDVALGTAIADFLRAHAAELDLYDVIWRQHIFTPERGGEGWRAMPDRGSATANHYDHVHVSVN